MKTIYLEAERQKIIDRLNEIEVERLKKVAASKGKNIEANIWKESLIGAEKNTLKDMLAFVDALIKNFNNK